MTRKRLEGALAEWHPHPKSANNSLVPVVSSTPAADDLADRFFDSTPQGYAPGPLPAAGASDASDAGDVGDATGRRTLIHSPEARERRRYLMRYVVTSVAVAGVIGLGALVRLGVSSFTHPASAATSTSADEMARATAVEIAPQANASPTTTIDEPSAPPATTTTTAPEPVATATTAPDDAKTAATESATTAPDPVTAAEAKREAQKALERGHLKASVEAGERSVALDPTDAEAWLILGAAYQGRGRYIDARRCFTTCSKVATRGDRSECRALLR
jgi:hypothetical protein